MLHSSGTVGQIWKQDSATGTQVVVGVGLDRSVMGGEVIGNRESAGSRDLQEGIAEVVLRRKTVSIERAVEGAVCIQKEGISRTIGCNVSPLTC